MPQPKLSTETDRQFFRRHARIMGLLIFFLWTNIFVGWLMYGTNGREPSALPAYASFGVIIAEWYLLAFLFALFPASLLFRVFVTSSGIVAFAFSMAIGAAWFDQHEVEMFLGTMRAWPLVVMAIAFPFLLAKHFFNWRLQVDWFKSHEPGQLSVAGLMIATAMAAIGLSLLRMGDDDELIGMLAFAAGCSGVSCLVFVPLTSLVLTRKRVYLWIFGVGLAGFGLAFLIRKLIEPAVFGGSFWARFGFSLTVMSALIFFGIGLLLLRQSGVGLRAK